MEAEKPSALEQRLQAAKERRERQQKEREAQRSGNWFNSGQWVKLLFGAE